MALLSSSSSSPPPPLRLPRAAPILRPPPPLRLPRAAPLRRSPRPSLSPHPNPTPSPWNRRGLIGPAASRVCEQEALSVDSSALAVRESVLDEELLAAVRLRVRTFYEFNPSSMGIEDHKRYLTEREFEALKDRVAGKRIGFKRVSCINATLPLSASLGSADGLCSACKFYENGDDKIVVGTLDLNQCLRLTDELTGKRPEGVGSDSRAYLSNVCVATELQRNGLGYALVAKSKNVAIQWGITDLYVHVAVDNEAAQKLYQKCGFVYKMRNLLGKLDFLVGLEDIFFGLI